MYEVGSQAVEIFASGIGIPVKASYGIAVMPYSLMKCCPVSARMCDAGNPFLLKGFGVLGHILFINSGCADHGFIWILFNRHY